MQNKLTFLYDGGCPLCKRESDFLKGRDKFGNIKFVDINSDDYDPKKYPELSKKQFNELCVCYIDGLVKIYDEEEEEYRASYNEPSDKFEDLEEEIIKNCIAKL